MNLTMPLNNDIMNYNYDKSYEQELINRYFSQETINKILNCSCGQINNNNKLSLIEKTDIHTNNSYEKKGKINDILNCSCGQLSQNVKPTKIEIYDETVIVEDFVINIDKVKRDNDNETDGDVFDNLIDKSDNESDVDVYNNISSEC